MIRNAMVLAGIFTGTSAIMSALKDRFIYYPNYPDGDSRFLSLNPRGYQNPGERGMTYDNIYLNTEDGVKLHAWLIKQQSNNCPTIVFFHENAGNMGMRMDNLEYLYKQLCVNIFILSYRGYGESQGFPNEEGLKLDAKAALSYIFGNQEIDGSKVFLFGRSLGGAVAIYSASQFKEYKFCGVILENTFMSINQVIYDLLPVLWPVSKIFLKKIWPSVERIEDVGCPMLFISGRSDLLILPYHMDKLVEMAKNARFVEVRKVELGGHNDTYIKAGDEYIEWLDRFMKRSLPKI